MKKLLLPVLGFILLGACQDTLDRPTEAKGPEKEIACRIADMGDNENPAAGRQNQLQKEEINMSHRNTYLYYLKSISEWKCIKK